MALISPTETIEGKIRSRIGEFLQLRAELNELALTLDPKVRIEVSRLLEEQKILEKELPDAVEAIDNPLGLVNMYTVYTFGNRMEKQIKAVRNLQIKAKGKPKEKREGINPFLIIKAIGIFFLVRKILK